MNPGHNTQLMKNYTICLFIPVIFYCRSLSAQYVVYNSYPSATATIFLDFDGHTVSGTPWNSSGPIVCRPSGLTNENIANIFYRVAEDYRPFNVNVTTDSVKYFTAPHNRRMRVIITVTSDWYGQAGGVAFIGSFTWGNQTPCFVFSALLGYNTKKISESISHEAGHTLGLNHQATYNLNCERESNYNYGQGYGETGWAPIMGCGYYQNLSLWHEGPSSISCNQIQNDLTIITSNNGFSYRPDDHPDTSAFASALSFTDNQFLAYGIVERNTDKDLFKFTIPSLGYFRLNAVPFNVGTGNTGANIDLKISLYTASNTLLNSYNPNDLLNVVIDTLLAAGMYFISVEGAGNRNMPAYGSLGSYFLTGFMLQAMTLPIHKLELQGSVNSNRHQLIWEIISDEPVIKQVLEVSVNNMLFNPLAEIDNANRSYSYDPRPGDIFRYRLKISTGNGQQYYSNIVQLRNSAASWPQLNSNFINNNILSVNSPAHLSYSVYSPGGSLSLKGQLKTGFNEIDISHLAAGLYFIRFTNGNDQWVEKWVKAK